jgi:hypothetical protein
MSLLASRFWLSAGMPQYQFIKKKLTEINMHLKLNTGLNENLCQSGTISPLRGQFYVFCAKKVAVI